MSKFGSTTSTSERLRPALSLAAPALLIALAYAGMVAWHGTPESDKLEQLTGDLERLRPVAASVQQVVALEQRREAIEAEVAQTEEQLAERKSRILEICQQDDSAIGRMQMLCTITDVLEERGLIVTQDKVLDTRPQLGGSLSAALRDLAASLEEVEKKERSAGGVPYLPPDMEIPPGMPLADLLASTRRVDTELHLREIKAWGTYADMVSAMEAVGGVCGESVVVGVGAERPSADVETNLLLWNIVVHTQPGAAEPEPEGSVDQLASQVNVSP